MVLRSEPELHQWADLGGDGSLRLHGQDLGVRELMGVDEYEWCFTVPAGHVAAFLAALGEPPTVPVLEAVARHAPFLAGAGLTEWFLTHGIEIDFWSRQG
ncbi:hypothetical protein ACIB24_19655 [Spongisporangium articulatum]|uniref:Uncharacterized protein n=1 Tax=Spongisporangium articulatum TaxID=3362603 RepID=A0ABW8ASB4_9ACTN